MLVGYTNKNLCSWRSQYTICVGHDISLRNALEKQLTFKNRAYRYPPDVAFYIYFFSKYKY